MKAIPHFRSHICLIQLLQATAMSALALELGAGGFFHLHPTPVFGHLITGHLFYGETLVVAFFANLSAAFSLVWTRRQVEVHNNQREMVAERDSLTNALTRSRFMEAAERRMSQFQLGQSANYAGPGFILMLMDVDHFKRINDTFGHAVGDHLLKTLVEVASHRTGWNVGRIGGDEFAVLVDYTDTDRLTDEIRVYTQELGSQLRQIDGRSAVGISIGIARMLDAHDVDTLLTCADLALYEAKRNGRRQFAFFDPEMRRRQIRELEVSRDLRSAIEKDHLLVYYQPVVGRERELKGAEALVRWRDPVSGRIIPPDEFISIAEQSTLIDNLGEWVFRQVCLDYRKSGFKLISINISGAQLMHDHLVPMLKAVLEETGCRADNFILEITETVAVSATPAVVAGVDELKRMGFILSLDDFGTGNSGFAFLRNMPFGSIKIDRSYVQKLADDAIAQVFVTGVGQLTKNLGFRVVAEGIETEEQYQLAKMAGATAFQGYLFWRPEPLKTRSDVPARLG